MESKMREIETFLASTLWVKEGRGEEKVKRENIRVYYIITFTSG